LGQVSDLDFEELLDDYTEILQFVNLHKKCAKFLGECYQLLQPERGELALKAYSNLVETERNLKEVLETISSNKVFRSKHLFTLYSGFLELQKGLAKFQHQIVKMALANLLKRFGPLKNNWRRKYV